VGRRLPGPLGDRASGLVLADGDAPTRTGLDRAWPGWDDGIDLVVAADGGARLAGALGLAIDAWPATAICLALPRR
jgi:hypothetical protein